MVAMHDAIFSETACMSTVCGEEIAPRSVQSKKHVLHEGINRDCQTSSGDVRVFPASAGINRWLK